MYPWGNLTVDIFLLIVNSSTMAVSVWLQGMMTGILPQVKAWLLKRFKFLRCCFQEVEEKDDVDFESEMIQISPDREVGDGAESVEALKKALFESQQEIARLREANASSFPLNIFGIRGGDDAGWGCDPSSVI